MSKFLLEIVYWNDRNKNAGKGKAYQNLVRKTIEAESEHEARRQVLNDLYSRGYFAKSISLIPKARAT